METRFLEAGARLQLPGRSNSCGRILATLLASCALLLGSSRRLGAQMQNPLNAKSNPSILQGVGIDQKLNQQIPLNLTFRDETGKTVRLGHYFGRKPVILSLVYFNCPMLCTLVTNALAHSMRNLNFTAGKQFNVLTISFDPHDTPQMAADKKAIYMNVYRRPGVDHGWHFLTGGQQSITALTQAVGFHYNRIPGTDQFAHATGIVVLTPQGKISQYFYGIQYPAGGLRLALVQASGGRIGNPVDELLLYCCEYNPTTGKYDFIVARALQIGGVITLLILGSIILIVVRSKPHPQG
jgi:protein SCO1/2